MMPKFRVALVLGSTREGRFCDVVAGWVREQFELQEEFAVTLVDPDQLKNEGIHDIQRDLVEADAYIVITPEYNHGYPAPLKFLIDSFYEEWRGKPVAFVSYGGQSGGIRAVEQLKQVFNELHTVSIRETVSFVRAWEQFDSKGKLISPAAAAKSMKALFKQLSWWAAALQAARSMRPYSEVTK